MVKTRRSVVRGGPPRPHCTATGPARYNRWPYGFLPYRGAAPTCELPMTAFGFACLVAVFLLTALVSVVTGGTSLITVPVMM